MDRVAVSSRALKNHLAKIEESFAVSPPANVALTAATSNRHTSYALCGSNPAIHAFKARDKVYTL